jgi:competence protein ComEC
MSRVIFHFSLLFFLFLKKIILILLKTRKTSVIIKTNGEGRGQNMKISSLFLILAILLCGVSCKKQDNSELPQIRFLDVGQGSSILIRSASGDILIDAGTETSQASLCRRLRALGVRELRLLVLTHTDEDHIGGADGVLADFPTDLIWVNGERGDSESFLRLEQMLSVRDKPTKIVSAGERFHMDDLYLTALTPMTDGEREITLLLRIGEFSALLMSDAGAATETDLISEYGKAQLDIDLLLVGHHGASDVCTERFLETTTPSYAVISCGAGNIYGHPDGRVLERLRAANLSVYRTDTDGEIVFLIKENRYAEVLTSEKK